MTRLVAANRVISTDGKEIKPGVVELDGECVVNVSALLGERPFTEWLGGTINLQYYADEQLCAYKDGKMLKEK